MSNEPKLLGLDNGLVWWCSSSRLGRTDSGGMIEPKWFGRRAGASGDRHLTDTIPNASALTKLYD